MKRVIFLLATIIVLFTSNSIAQENLDIKVDVIDNQILPDDPLRFQVSIFRLGEQREDIYFQYFIGNENNLKLIKSESIAVEKIGSFFREVELPSNTIIGENNLFVTGTIRETEAQATETFNIVKSLGYVKISNTNLTYFLFILTILVISFIIFVIYDYRLSYKMLKMYNKIQDKDLR